MLATGISHVLALDTAGNVFSWGSNNSGQLGIESKASAKASAKKGQTSDKKGRSGGAADEDFKIDQEESF